ncbi:inner membrane complex protein 1j, putative [Plasmodium malariae]|nr:inner membrane complex protein 1j, putative [Plasmodium malariae]SCO93170.1 inner membrane complex protein 1j, putative [Plasmodium malariae]
MEDKQCKLLLSECCKGNYAAPVISMNIESDQAYEEGNDYTYQSSERPVINVKGDQPVFNIPVYQDKYVRDKIIESSKYEIQDVVQPKYYSQETKHDVPTVELLYKERKINIPQEKILENPVDVDIPIGYVPIYSPIWDVREIPRVIPKYEGEQKIIEVEVPQIKYIDKYVEKEIIVDIKEKIVPKITEMEKQVDIVKYQWKEKYQDVPVCKYVPKIDVELDCPPPLIVPYPEVHFQNISEVLNPNQKAIDIPPELLKNNTSYIQQAPIMNREASEKRPFFEFARLISKKDRKLGSHQGDQEKSQIDSYREIDGYKEVVGYREVEDDYEDKNDIVLTPDGQRQNVEDKNKKTKKKNWLFCSFNNCKDQRGETSLNDIDPQTGYPKSMPKDFSAFFKKDLNKVKKQMGIYTDTKSTASSNFIEKSPVNPTIEYVGKIDKPPIDGGKLDSISFKLHAIEVHQFIPVPNMPKPKFLDLVPPENFEQNDISSIQNLFGSTSEGWVDPKITGFIAPMMNDVLHGNVQPQSPFFNKLSINNNKNQTKSFTSIPGENCNSDNYKYVGNYHGGMDHTQQGDYQSGMDHTQQDDYQSGMDHMQQDDYQSGMDHMQQDDYINYDNNSSLNYINENYESHDAVIY